ncbi:hypothetical protein AMB3_3140 [plant metagenome]|uniref:Uncharacterized protein n=1 Tax=plant metagenome TaxID=1297885 RepID=A0A484TMA9_9ZZZZ
MRGRGGGGDGGTHEGNGRARGSLNNEAASVTPPWPGTNDGMEI